MYRGLTGEPTSGLDVSALAVLEAQILPPFHHLCQLVLPAQIESCAKFRQRMHAACLPISMATLLHVRDMICDIARFEDWCASIASAEVESSFVSRVRSLWLGRTPPVESSCQYVLQPCAKGLCPRVAMGRT